MVREMKKARYCEMCDKWVPVNQRECRACGAPTLKAESPPTPREACHRCDGDGFGPLGGNCEACGGSGKLEYCAACDREGATAGGDTTPLEFHACQSVRRG